MRKKLTMLLANKISLFASMLLLACSPVSGKTTVVEGVCVDAKNQPIEGVLVKLMVTKKQGLFKLPEIVEVDSILTKDQGQFRFLCEGNKGWILEIHEDPESWRNIRFTIPKEKLAAEKITPSIRITEEKVTIDWGNSKKTKDSTP